MEHQSDIVVLGGRQIVRPGGMERPTDAFKETHNLVLYRKDSLSGGQVSRLQVFFNLSLPLTVTWLNQSKRSTDLVIQLDRELTNRRLFVIKIMSLESGFVGANRNFCIL
jgi:hypothetical protein